MSDENRKKVYTTALSVADHGFTIFMSHNGTSWIMQCDSDIPGAPTDVAWEKFYAALNNGNWHAWVTLDGAREQMKLAAKAVGAGVPLWRVHALQDPSTKASCSVYPETEYVLCQILIEGGVGIASARREKTIAHLQTCALCEAEGQAIVERLKKAVGGA